MSHPLLDRKVIEQAPKIFLNATGNVFALFDEHLQDSGNVSYGVQVGLQRFFVKTAGILTIPAPFCPTSKG